MVQQGMATCPCRLSAGVSQALTRMDTVRSVGMDLQYVEMVASGLRAPTTSTMAQTLTNLQAGSVFELSVHITAHHMGHFEFAICDQHVSGDLEDPQACFDARKLHRADPPADCVPNDARGDCQPIQVEYPERWYLPPAAGTHTMRFKIPSDLSCTSCTLQWRWWTANSCIPAPNYGCFFDLMAQEGWNTGAWCSFCGTCGAFEEGHYSCGEEFRNCADIVVRGTGATTVIASSTAATSATATSSDAVSSTPAPASTVPETSSSAPPEAGSCVWNRNCAESAWCNDATFEAWCPANPCPSPHCVRVPATTDTTSAGAATTTTTTTPAATTIVTVTVVETSSEVPGSTTTLASTPAATSSSTIPAAGGACVWNRNCAESAWCNDGTLEAWCPLNPCPSPHCVQTPASTGTTSGFLATTTTTTPVATTTRQCVPIGDCSSLGFCDQTLYANFCAGQQGNCPAPFCTSA
mmetsp:Transcript_3254/g.5333  ORF Transcript_3254/g.5333 Transcript_3254/m.5333 type:complete len:466 (+) Transcript_3254:160-1557(+)